MGMSKVNSILAEFCLSIKKEEEFWFVDIKRNADVKRTTEPRSLSSEPS